MLAEQRATGFVYVIIIIIGRYLHEIEWYFAQSELLSPLFHQQLQTVGIAVARVAHIGTALIEEDAFHRIVQNRIESAVAPEQRTIIISIVLFHHRHRVEWLVGIFLQVFLGQPTLHAAASFVCQYQSHGDVERAVYHAGEEISRRAAFAHGVRIHRFPFALGVFLRSHPHGTGHFRVVNAFGIHGIRHHFVVSFHRAVAESAHGHFHITLSCAHPYLA